jgi:hypothetical protein
MSITHLDPPRSADVDESSIMLTAKGRAGHLKAWRKYQQQSQVKNPADLLVTYFK